MASRSAESTIKGYFYQFDNSILEILRLANDNDTITIEGIEDQLLGEALKATVVVRGDNGKELMTERLKEHCAAHLALYKVPQVFELKEQLVISATGKKIKGKL